MCLFTNFKNGSKLEEMTKINYEEIIEKFPWIVLKNQNCILSPDSDGLLCGLLLSHYLKWNIVGFYDGKILLLNKNFKVDNCIFIDMEIFRKDIKSVGHHMNIHNLSVDNQKVEIMLSNCINPNLLRRFDRAHNFNQKYPLGSIHLLMYILENRFPGMININDDGLAAIFFADGVWKILFKYTNNILDWFDYLHAGTESIWWQKLQKISVLELINGIDNLLKRFIDIHPENKNWYGHIDISHFDNQKKLLEKNLNLFDQIIGWRYDKQRWLIDNFSEYHFNKKIFEGSRSQDVFMEIIRKKPISLAMTNGNTMQYTLEEPDKLPI